MKDCYKQELSYLIEIVTKSRELIIKNHEKFKNSTNSLFALGDEIFEKYASIVFTNEFRASKSIERIAVSLFTKMNYNGFQLYPIDEKLPQREAAKNRPFQIIIKENEKKIGIIFSNFSDAGDCFRNFIDGNYKVDSIKLVILSAPDEFGKETLFTSVNKYNSQCGIAIERIPILDFWKTYFGDDECAELIEFANEFNKKSKEIIGFNTIISPTDKALEKFKSECGYMLKTYDYEKDIPESVYDNQVRIIKRNYIDRDLWKAMISNNDFAISFITSEWFYKIYMFTENLDLTNIVAGYLKSIEQLLFRVIELSKNAGITIKTKNKEVVEFSEQTESIVDTTLWALEQVIQHNKILDVNKYAKDYLISTIDDWRENQRNGYFHKHNLHSIEKTNEIRNKAIQLYFLILGSLSIKDEQLSQLGIEQ